MSEDQGQAAAAVPGGRDAPGRPILLLVDDDAPLRRSLQRAMARRGFTVHAAETLQGGLELARLIKPEYAVIDLGLEDGTGLELARRLRKLRPLVRILILTGDGNVATAARMAQAGALEYLAKPADADQVTSALLGSTLRTSESRP